MRSKSVARARTVRANRNPTSSTSRRCNDRARLKSPRNDDVATAGQSLLGRPSLRRRASSRALGDAAAAICVPHRALPLDSHRNRDERPKIPTPPPIGSTVGMSFGGPPTPGFSERSFSSPHSSPPFSSRSPIRVEIWLKFKYEVPGSKNLDPSRKLRAGQPQALPSDEDDGSGGSCGGGCARRQNVGHDNDNTPSSSCFVPATTSRGGAFTTFGRSCDREANGQNLHLLRTVGGPRTLRGLRCVCVDDGVRE